MKNQSKNKNIDEQLRELDNQQLPDLSQIDKHWQAISAVQVSRPFYRKPIFFLNGLIIVAVVILFLINLAHVKEVKQERLSVNDKINADSTVSALNNLPVSISLDTVPEKHRHPIKAGKKTDVDSIDSIQRIKNVPRKTKKKNVLYSVKKSSENDHLKTDQDSAIQSTVVKNPSQSLAEFLLQIESPSQIFTINNKFDTIILGQSGSAFWIPARSLGAGEVITIKLTECYNRRDFVCNRLVTISGTKQLVSAGMVKIEAFEGQKKVELDSSNKIRWYMPPGNFDLAGMELFEGVDKIYAELDSELTNATNPLITWEPTWKPIVRQNIRKSTKVVDIRNTPYKTKYKKGGEIGYFVLAENAVISSQQLADSLKSRFGYKKVYVKQEYSTGYNIWRNAKVKFKKYDSESLGDSTEMDSTKMKFYKLEGKETTRINYVTTSFYQDSTVLTANFNTPLLMELVKDRYGVDLKKLGWINCDRFSNDPRPNRPLIVDLGDTAKNYYTILVFNKLAVTLEGFAIGNSQNVKFARVPDGEKVTVISVGSRNGKICSAMKEFVCGSGELNILTGFTECSPKSFKKSLTILDQRPN